ncbi:hypothetical protein PVA45_06695 [Entomospira entomophila]|uniref:Uncharacterized protein n=1 Tax=Entomospira entomophila TaxID=2719988 RepID=A0A968KRW8_9SPIO|nr:hypothetical protein [Entomospira entomophilus]NIZ41188.1 hypothetical protein [Entomospira entomophilus]WDI35395.1 hypothetical protein PVA45_06695 [Entomospira entomophilus]
MWQKKPSIPTSSTAQDRYKHVYVLPKLEDERAQQKLNFSVGIMIAISLGLFGWMLLRYTFHLFDKGFLLFILGVILVLVFIGIGWLFGLRIARKASQMRIDRYYDLYDKYTQHIQDVERTRNALMKAEENLAKTEKSLDSLIAQTHNRPALLAGMAAISAVIMESLPFHKNRSMRKSHGGRTDENHIFSSVDLTDDAVYQHESQRRDQEE